MIRKFFDKGKRSKVYLGYLNGKMIAIKEIESGFLYNIKNEARFLKILNKYDIGPKFVKEGRDFIIYEFAKGERIIDWLKKNRKIKIKKNLLDVLKQCWKLDKLKINKYEMHNPYKHILIDKKPVMIDFERCKYVQRPKNVTQFCQFLMSKKIKEILEEKGFKTDDKKLKELLKKYKESYKEKLFKKILKIMG